MISQDISKAMMNRTSDHPSGPALEGFARRELVGALGASAAIALGGVSPAQAVARNGLATAMQRQVDSGFVPGLVAALWSHGSLDVQVRGNSAFGGLPMRRDSLFRMASTTKLVTATAAMILVEDGKIGLDEPVDRYLPELAGRHVLRSVSGPLGDTVPAARSVTLRDLLTLRFGLGTIMPYPTDYPIQKAIDQRRLFRPFAPYDGDPDEFMRLLGELPLVAQPGAQWLYHTGMDVAGVLVARVANTTLGAFMKQRIFDPLGMKDTGFFVPADKLSRLVEFYRSDPVTHKATIYRDSWTRFDKPPPFESGGGGLVSTIDDFMTFCLMLLDRGTFRGVTVLSAAAVAEMTRNQLTASQLSGPQVDVFFEHSSGWGLGMAVALKRTKPWLTPGRFGWDGGFGTQAYIDPAKRTVGILLTQRLVDTPSWPPTYTAFWQAAYG